MFFNFKKWGKDFFTLSRNEQRGIYTLLILIFALFLIRYVLIPFYSIRVSINKEKQDTAFYHQVSQFIKLQHLKEDSLKQLRLEKHKKKLTPFSFDPNKMTLKTGLKLGLSKNQVQPILNYIKKGGRFYNKKDFQKIYSISSNDYEILAPYIHISMIPPPGQKFHQVYINQCSENDLANNLHIPSYLAKRIIKYRKALGNFYSKTQLKEVYGLSNQTYNKISPWILCDSNRVHKIDLNNASFKELLHHPYLNYENTLKIVKIRSRLHGYSSLTQIVTDANVADSVFHKIRHYLYIRPQKIPNQ